jgi:GGDEF domain-containing protein
VARRMAQALVAPEVIGGRQLSIAASMGVSVLTDELAGDQDESAALLYQARTALSRARSSGGGSHVLYSDYSAGSASKGSSAQALYVHPDWQGRPR